MEFKRNNEQNYMGIKMEKSKTSYQIALNSLFNDRGVPDASCLVPVVWCLGPTTCCLLPEVCRLCLLPGACYILPAAWRLLLAGGPNPGCVMLLLSPCWQAGSAQL